MTHELMDESLLVKQLSCLLAIDNTHSDCGIISILPSLSCQSLIANDRFTGTLDYTLQLLAMSKQSRKEEA